MSNITPLTDVDTELNMLLDNLIVEAVYAYRDSPDPSVIPSFSGKDHAQQAIKQLIGIIAEQERQDLLKDLDNYTAKHDQPFVEWTKDWLHGQRLKDYMENKS